MPYIKRKDRRRLNDEMGAGHVAKAQKAGGLNYIITLCLRDALPEIQNYIERKGESYQTYNDVFGALFGACHELIRRKLPDYAKYENRKIKENGDVYDDI